MSGVGNRFDLEAACEEQRRKNEVARIRKIIQAVVLVVVLLLVVFGGKAGWDYWQAKQHEKAEAEAAEAARQEAARVKQQKERAEKARLAKEKQEKIKAEKEAERLRKQQEREEKIRREREEKERIAREKQEARERAEREKEEQEELRQYGEDMLSTVRFALSDHVIPEYDFKDCFDLACSDDLWRELSAVSLGRNAALFFDLVRPDSLTNEFVRGKFPSREIMMDARRKLDGEKFNLSVTQKAQSKNPERPVLVKVDGEDGLVVPDDVQEIKDGKRFIGWTTSFVYGDREPFFIMSVSTAKEFRSEWKRQYKAIMTEQKRYNLTAETVRERKEELRVSFVNAIKVQLQTPPPPPAAVKKTTKPAKPKPPKENRVFDAGGKPGNRDKIRRL